MSSSYTLTGSLLEAETDAPFVGLLVEAHAVDTPHDRRLGGTLTDANGAFGLVVNESLDPDDPPQIRFTVYIDGRSTVIYQSDPFQVETSPHDLGRLRITPIPRAAPSRHTPPPSAIISRKPVLPLTPIFRSTVAFRSCPRIALPTKCSNIWESPTAR